MTPEIETVVAGLTDVAVDIDYDAAMRLADGVTCNDCASSKRCFAFGFSEPARTTCDFYPSRFRTALQGQPS